jgi:hypothetical protein
MIFLSLLPAGNKILVFKGATPGDSVSFAGALWFGCVGWVFIEAQDHSRGVEKEWGRV